MPVKSELLSVLLFTTMYKEQQAPKNGNPKP